MVSMYLSKWLVWQRITQWYVLVLKVDRLYVCA